MVRFGRFSCALKKMYHGFDSTLSWARPRDRVIFHREHCFGGDDHLFEETLVGPSKAGPQELPA